MKIAVIPARGGSKRIKGKNIRAFAGKPLISYSIRAARQTGLFDAIVVSTDSNDIADIALASGASDIILRPAELADDFTGTTPVVQHAIRTFEQPAELVCCIYATAPFLSPASLIEGCQKLSLASDMQYAFSVTTFDFPIQRAIRMDGQGVSPVDKAQIGKRSQDLETLYHDAGQFYWGRRDAWLAHHPMFSPQSIPVVLPHYLVQDIDTEEDWVRAELMYKAYQEQINHD
ncbi:pseudaminic acid cytidylyltransferase [Aestuariibacter sp. GS-14]|uniref:pseudaminic acid cytidylyltransferase n=1 Tax=Aestuariibacter sp. GS-14 TaxID=2590670 RepID=UPI0011298189|nr:pseudaminic acid cytidylyltransferase [Aestuariibacter sp. GS-14]TPV61976.1 pseudaminic acid cytidylyltransferase [Aestuariibacter sp. GS-14]